MSTVSTVTTSTTALVQTNTQKSKKRPFFLEEQQLLFWQFAPRNVVLQCLHDYDFCQLHTADGLAFSVVKAKKEEITQKITIAEAEKAFYTNPENVQLLLLRDFA